MLEHGAIGDFCNQLYRDGFEQRRIRVGRVIPGRLTNRFEQRRTRVIVEVLRLQGLPRCAQPGQGVP